MDNDTEQITIEEAYERIRFAMPEIVECKYIPAEWVKTNGERSFVSPYSRFTFESGHTYNIPHSVGTTHVTALSVSGVVKMMREWYWGAQS